MGHTLWTDPQTGIEEEIEDDNPMYGIFGASNRVLMILEDGHDPATYIPGDEDRPENVLDDLVGYFDILDAGVPVVGTDANGVWPDIKLYADVVTAARVVADQHRIGTVSAAAYQSLTDENDVVMARFNKNRTGRTRSPSFNRGTAAHAAHDA